MRIRVYRRSGHVDTNRTQPIYTVVVHYPVPRGRNFADIEWRDVIVDAGRAVTTLQVGADPWQIVQGEKDDLDQGVKLETSFAWPVDPNWSRDKRREELYARVRDEVKRHWKDVAEDLAHFGRKEDLVDDLDLEFIRLRIPPHITYNTDVITDRMDAVLAAIDVSADPATLQLWTDDYAAMLYSVELDDPSFAETDGVLTMLGGSKVADAIASGVPRLARILNGNSVVVVQGLRVGTAGSGAEVIVNSQEILAGQSVTVLKVTIQ